MALFLGVDGGQSSTIAVLGDETGRVLGRGAGGPCNHVKSGEGYAKLTSAIRESVSLACAAANLDADTVHFESACFGMSGGPDDKRSILAGIIRSSRLAVTHDAAIALSGAIAGQPGIITIAGTGSMSYGRNGAGKNARAGGWGYVFGDDGGGFDIVRQALRAVLRNEEGWGTPTALCDAMLQETGCVNANELLHLLYTSDWPRARIAALARLVDDVATRGDTLARQTLEIAAQQLFSLTASVHHQLFHQGDSPSIAYVGGVFNSRVLLDRFGLLVQLEFGAPLTVPKYGPATGALLEAYRDAGVQVTLQEQPGLK